VLGAAVIAITIVGGWLFVGFVALVGWIMAFEWERLTNAKPLLGGLVINALASTSAIVSAHLGALEIALGAIGLGVLARLLMALSQRERPWWRIGGIAYVALPTAALVALRVDNEFGLGSVLWIFAVVWATDTGAYVVGKTVGGPKLSSTSPNKTWAGLAGGVVLAGLAGAFVANWFAIGSIALFGGLGLVGAFLSQGGDLFESWVKRRFQAKDSGRLIPGHGGVLDRVDGLLPVTVVAAVAVGIVRESGTLWS